MNESQQDENAPDLEAEGLAILHTNLFSTDLRLEKKGDDWSENWLSHVWLESCKKNISAGVASFYYTHKRSDRAKRDRSPLIWSVQ